MKRIWFAVIFLALAAVMCTAEQIYIHDFYSNMNIKISAAEAALDNKDYKKYAKYEKEISEYWKRKNNILYVTGEHKELDTIAVQIRSVPYDRGDEKKELHALSAQLCAYYENEKISLANIF